MVGFNADIRQSWEQVKQLKNLKLDVYTLNMSPQTTGIEKSFRAQGTFGFTIYIFIVMLKVTYH